MDINELRRKLRSDDLIDHIDIHANVKSTLAELMDRLEAAEKSDAESIRMYRKSRDERMGKMEAGLQIAMRQNSHDMLMTGDELRQCEAAMEESK